MRSNIKKILILLILILVAIPGILFLLKIERGGEVVPGQKYLPPVKIPNYLQDQKLTVNFRVEKENYNVPVTLPILQVTHNPIAQQDIMLMAKNLGFDDPPRVTEDVFDGTTFIYLDNNYSLVIYQKIAKINYTTESDKTYTNKKLSDDAIKKIAEDFVINNKLVEKGQFNTSSILYLNTEGVEGIKTTSKDQANFYQVNFSYLLSDHPILTINPLNSPIYVWVAPDGSVFKAQVEIISGIKKSDDEYKIKTYEETASSVNGAVIAALDEGNFNIADVPKGSILEINIQNIKLAYFYEPEKPILQPVFLLEGEARTTISPDNFEISLYLEAISKNR